MRPALIVLAIASLAAPAIAAEPATGVQQARLKPSEAEAGCRYQPQQAVQRGKSNGAIKLADAPPARLERAVNRTIDGCPVPVIVRHDVEKK